MPNNAATEAAPLSIAPMMDWADNIENSIVWMALCAMYVFHEIDLWSTLSGVWRLPGATMP